MARRNRKDDVTEEELRLIQQMQEEEEKKGRSTGPASCGPAPWKSIKTEPDWALRVRQNPELGRICIRECGVDGDCLFYAISTGLALHAGLSPAQIRQNDYSLMMGARKWLAESINVNNMNQFLHDYQQEKFHSDMADLYQVKNAFSSWPTEQDTWDPDTFGSTRPVKWVHPETKLLVEHEHPIVDKLRPAIDPDSPDFNILFEMPQPGTLAQRKRYSAQHAKLFMLQTILETPGYTYQGDDFTLRYLAAGPKMTEVSMGFLVISTRGQISCEIYPSDQPRDYYMMLLNVEEVHWQLAGYATGRNQVQVVISRTQLPRVITELYTKDCGSVPHVMR